MVDVKLLEGDKYFVFSLIKYMEKEMVVNVKPGGNMGNMSIVIPAHVGYNHFQCYILCSSFDMLVKRLKDYLIVKQANFRILTGRKDKNDNY